MKDRKLENRHDTELEEELGEKLWKIAEQIENLKIEVLLNDLLQENEFEENCILSSAWLSYNSTKPRRTMLDIMNISTKYICTSNLHALLEL